MRYYSIKLKNAPAVFKPVQGASIEGAQWDTWINGQNDPGAQQIEFSIEIQEAAAPTENSTIVIKGVPWDQITESANLIGAFLEMHGGMKPGLPLATVQDYENNLLITGQILKAWGNWEGTEMSIGMMVAVGMDEQKQASGNGGGNGASQIASTVEGLIGSAGGGGGSAPAALKYMSEIRKAKYRRTGSRSIDRRPYDRGPTISPTPMGIGGGGVGGGFDMSGLGVFGGLAGGLFGGGGMDGGLTAPLNLVHNMQPNASLSSSIQETLSKAFPQANVSTAIHSGLKLPYQDAGMYQSMSQYAGYLKNLSHSIMGAAGYGGIKMTSHGNDIHVFDGTQPSVVAGVVSVTDLIGQPTWVDQLKVHIKTVLRGDLKIGDVITLPPNILWAVGPNANAIGANGAASPQRTNLSFTGSFQITKITHVGDFRSPHGSDWATNYECSVQTEGGGTLTQGSKAIDNSSDTQNPNQTPPSNSTPDLSPSIPGTGTGVPQMLTRIPFGVTPPFKRDVRSSVNFGSVHKRGVRRYG